LSSGILAAHFFVFSLTILMAAHSTDSPAIRNDRATLGAQQSTDLKIFQRRVDLPKSPPIVAPDLIKQHE
jgi:hypothetical protein